MRRVMPGRRLLSMAGLVSLMLLAPVLAVPAVSAVPVPAGGQPSEPQVRQVLNDVHTDVLDPVFESGTLRVRTRIGTSGSYEYADPGDVVIQLKDTADSRLQVPDIPEFAFLGEAGSPVWIAPEAQITGLVWPGWSTENLPRELFEFGAPRVELTLTDVTGPGALEVFASGTVGQPIRYFSSTDPQIRTFNEFVGTHHHANWVFTAPGTYTATFQIAATDVNGTRHVAEPVTLNWYVGGTTAEDVPPELVSPSPTTSPTTSP
ncbi:choice-of-anchor M domain-containing protein, partial [Actinomadura adrarensis]